MYYLETGLPSVFISTLKLNVDYIVRVLNKDEKDNGVCDSNKKAGCKRLELVSCSNYVLFFNENGFPGVIGAVDCTHVRIQKPNIEIEACYLNRKGYHSKNVQLVCDFNLKILSVIAKFGGSSHDSYIWDGSQVKSLLERRYVACDSGEHSSWLFRCLKLGLCYSPPAAGRIINACCMLHNFRLKHEMLPPIYEQPR
ncbi:putative nuclease HARBI1 [Eupeodes corollae]|uniref:putative nuclease HARBI1 n=1 Tax=Eupeodes corollae TaxID=290404 RepID=UPI0024910D19|nr:putative nuclease HARBI1 [Eupeodes corollae]